MNHFKNHTEVRPAHQLTRKDNLAKNLKRYRKSLEKDSPGAEDLPMWFFPQSFQMPREFALFKEELAKHPGQLWIMKPAGRSQGKGIFLVNKLSAVLKWSPENSAASAVAAAHAARKLHRAEVHREPAAHRRQEVRLPALRALHESESAHAVPLPHGLRALLAPALHGGRPREQVYPRVTTDIHCTNVAVQKSDEKYQDGHNSKWELRNLKLFLASRFGAERVEQCFAKIQEIFVHSLKAVQALLTHDKHCFELFGYDVMLDSDLRPWLLEVNAYPSLTASTKDDEALKVNMLDDALSILDLEKLYPDLTQALRKRSAGRRLRPHLQRLPSRPARRLPVQDAPRHAQQQSTPGSPACAATLARQTHRQQTRLPRQNLQHASTHPNTPASASLAHQVSRGTVCFESAPR